MTPEAALWRPLAAEGREVTLARDAKPSGLSHSFSYVVNAPNNN